MPTAVGLDIGTQSIKVAVLDGSASKPRLVDFVDWRCEPGQTTRSLGPDGLAATIRRILEDRRIPTDNIATEVDAARCLARELQVPFSRDDQIAKTIKFQAESVFHSTSIDELLVEYYKIEEIRPPAGKEKSGASERSRLVVIALKKSGMREHLDLLERAGVDPVAVDLDMAAIFNAWSRTKSAEDGRPTLIVDLGAGSMKALVVEGGRIRGMRALRAQAAGIKVGEKKKPRVTLDDLRAGLAQEDRDDAFFMEEEGRLPVVILDDEQSEIFDLAGETEEMRQSVLEKILLEIDRTLAATRLDAPIERVLLTGGGAAVEGLEKAFSEHFGAPCERFTLRGAFAEKSPRHAAAVDLVGATAVGLALKALGWDKTGIDFRKEEFAFAGKFDKAKRGVACSLVLLFTFFFLLAFDYQNVEMRRLVKKQARLEEAQETIYHALFPDDPRPPRGYLAALRAKQSELKGGSVDVPDIVSTLDMLRDLAQGFEESGKKDKFWLKQLSFRQGNATLRGEVDVDAVAYDLKDAVNAKPRLVTLEVEKVTPNKEGKFDVNFKVIAKVPEKKTPSRTPRPAAAEED